MRNNTDGWCKSKNVEDKKIQRIKRKQIIKGLIQIYVRVKNEK